MANLEDIYVTVHATDKSIHEVFAEIIEKYYEETGVQILGVRADWYESFGSKYLVRIDMDSRKGR